MEEDIKILERYLEKIDRSKASFNRFRFLKAIENLIKGYRKLEDNCKMTKPISMQELQAINKKCKELRLVRR